MNFCWKTMLCICMIVLGQASAEDKGSDDRMSAEEITRLRAEFDKGKGRPVAGSASELVAPPAASRRPRRDA